MCDPTTTTIWCGSELTRIPPMIDDLSPQTFEQTDWAILILIVWAVSLIVIAWWGWWTIKKEAER